MKTLIKKYTKQIVLLLVALFVLSCSKDDPSSSIIENSNMEITSFNSLNTTNTFLLQDVIAISQRQILQSILDANPNNTLGWNLTTIENLGDLTGIVINTQGHIIELDLSEKMLFVLPLETWSLINLRYLNLSSNQLTSIPKGI